MKLYLIRHGQTTHNVTGQHQGWAPVRLTEAGMDMAREARKKLADIHFDRIHCSDLLRTRQTAELIFPDEYKSGAITFEANLREINNTLFSGRTGAKVCEDNGYDLAVYRSHQRELDVGIYGAEDTAHLRGRVQDFLNRMAEAADKDGLANIAAVTHGGVIHAALTNVIGAPADIPVGRIPILVGNCSVHVLEWINGGWRIFAVNCFG